MRELWTLKPWRPFGSGRFIAFWPAKAPNPLAHPGDFPAHHLPLVGALSRGGLGWPESQADSRSANETHRAPTAGLYCTLATKNPLQVKFPFALWTRALVRELIWCQWQIQLSVPSVGRLLAQLGFSCQKPLVRALERNPALVRRWVAKGLYPPIKRLAQRHQATIYFADEAGCDQIIILARLGRHGARPLRSTPRAPA